VAPRAIEFAILPVRCAPDQNRKFNGTSPSRVATGSEASNADGARTHLGEMKRFAGESPINGRDLSTVRFARWAFCPPSKPHSKWEQALPAAARAGPPSRSTRSGRSQCGRVRGRSIRHAY